MAPFRYYSLSAFRVGGAAKDSHIASLSPKLAVLVALITARALGRAIGGGFSPAGEVLHLRAALVLALGRLSRRRSPALATRRGFSARAARA